MNKQYKMVNGQKVNTKIEWTDYTFNPIAGCRHACQWRMPDGQIANCYAEDVAEGIARAAYPDGFEAHYWYPDRLDEPAKVKEPSKIFVGSMADVFGHWVPSEQISNVLLACEKAHWHTFQFLTKNPLDAVRNFYLPDNAWLGASTPPDFIWNKPLSQHQQDIMLRKTLQAFQSETRHTVTWLSAEPLSWDITPILKNYPNAVDWIVIGAASNGPRYYPPAEAHVRALVELCDDWNVPIFMKGNLRSLPWAVQNWRVEFPYEERQPVQMRLFDV